MTEREQAEVVAAMEEKRTVVVYRSGVLVRMRTYHTEDEARTAAADTERGLNLSGVTDHQVVVMDELGAQDAVKAEPHT